MSGCEDVAGLRCSYVDVHTDEGNVTLFTWWLTLGHDAENNVGVRIQFTVLLIITIIAIIANLVVLSVIFSNKKLLKIPTHQYTAAQTINYLWFICVSPMLLSARKSFSWTNSQTAMCKMILYTFSVTTFIAIWLFVFISMDRHIHVVQSVRKSRLSKIYPKYPIVAILLLVIFSVSFYVPLTVFFQVLPVIDDHCTNATKCFAEELKADDTVFICTSLWPSADGALAWNIVMLLISYVFPTIIISYNYWEIYSNVRKVRKRLRTRKGQRKASRRELEIHVTTMCALLVVLFIVMWTPVFIVLFLVQFSRVQKQPGNEAISSVLFYWIFCLTLTNAMVNPLVYAFLNTRFMKAWEDYRFPLLDRCMCWSRFVKKANTSKVDATVTENPHTSSHNETNTVHPDMTPKQTKNTELQRQESRTSLPPRRQEISVIVTPPDDNVVI